MKVVIATPLFPPDTTEAAAYAKELAKRLAGRFEVIVVSYGQYPETASGARIVTVDKRLSIQKRLSAFLRTLVEHARGADALVVINGPSAELPVLLFSCFHSTPLVFAGADKGVPWSPFSFLLQFMVSLRSKKIIQDFPPPRPEVLPLEPRPTEALDAYERAWDAHTSLLESFLTHAR